MRQNFLESAGYLGKYDYCPLHYEKKMLNTAHTSQDPDVPKKKKVFTIIIFDLHGRLGDGM